MNKVSIVENDLIAVWVYPDRKMIHHMMKAYCFGPEFREALTRGLEAMELYRATKWLSDDRANGALPPEDGAWAGQEWSPRALAAGWKHWAVVQPAKIIGQINMERFVKDSAARGLNARMFGDPEEAMRWLDAA